MKPVPDEISEYMAKIGAKGGKAKGAKKKRPKDHYKKVLGDIHRKRAAANRARKEAKK